MASIQERRTNDGKKRYRVQIRMKGRPPVTKNGETRSVPIVKHSHLLLSEQSKVRRIDTKLLFPGPRSPFGDVRPCSIRTAWESALSKAEISEFRFHDLRHSCASYLAMNGASATDIAEVLGHKTLQMVMRYAHLELTPIFRQVALRIKM